MEVEGEAAKERLQAGVACSDRERFLLELEFVQSLANPGYLNCEGLSLSSRCFCCSVSLHQALWLDTFFLEHAFTFPLIFAAGLAQSRQLEDNAFVEYLKYLQYWKRPEYARYIM
jgi:SOH1